MSIPTLVTDRLILRGLSEDDAGAYERHFVDYEVIRHLSATAPWPHPEGGVRREVWELTKAQWMVWRQAHP